MPSIKLNDIELYYEIYGEGTPLILVPGMSSDSQSWLSIVKKLSQHYLLIIPDNRGVGRTKPQDAENSIQKISDDYFALLNYLELTHTTIAGHSMGGFVALDLALRYPNHVSKLILAATSAFNSERNNALNRGWITDLKSGLDLGSWYRNIFQWLFSKNILNDKGTLNDLIQLAVENPYRQSLVAFINQTEAIAKFNLVYELPNIKSKTMLVCGSEDILFPPEDSIRILQAIPDIHVTIIENAAHSIHIENPKEFINCILNFLKESN